MKNKNIQITKCLNAYVLFTDEMTTDVVDSGLQEDSPAPAGIPDPYYPIALPIDQAFKAKYVFHHRRGKTFQEKCYVFLEHPVGWICFIYHITV